ncbi:DUF3225 domain-containing protein [Halobiforma nitratireducens]|uniref:Uncharacterized protein n=1 Tax=Halobiforma nitratireducens JCM 10879 TaxID=1227454 RepID=M0LTB0_9EURY|nr:DUF3225 domain-containing protein [Halobiforma nitratireducens]EMA36797.1 hypothetical protein C446_11332 [Halobiforma nitratireducens JCM 10879]
MSEAAEAVVLEYYEALERGDPLAPYFLESESTVKFGIGESLFGSETVADALRTQTETTTDWTVGSHHLVVEERDGFATFADEVTIAWTDVDTGEDREFESRWSGTLVKTESRREPKPEDVTGSDTDPDAPSWRFATMHVSAPRRLE